MGYYVNPKGKSKEEWLCENKVREISPSMIDDMSLGNMVVCLMDNGSFTAAAVIYSAGEYEYFSRNDGRRKWWFEVPRDKLVEVGAIPEYVEAWP